MRFLEVLIFLGCVFHLAFAKAQMAIDDETFFDKDEFEPGAEEAFLEDVREPEGEEEEDEDAKPVEYLKPNENDDRRRQIMPTSRPFRYSVTVPISIPLLNGQSFFRLCYCFRKKCDVEGMYAGFKGWEKSYLTGYVVVGKTLYYFYPCRPGIIPKPTKAGTPRPPMTRGRG